MIAFHQSFHRLISLLLIAVSMAWASPATADGEGDPSLPQIVVKNPVYVAIDEVETVLINAVYQLNCRSTLRLPDAPLKALHSGLPLVFLLSIDVKRHRHWWFDALLARTEVRFRIEYLDITRRYRVSQVNSGEYSTHTTLTGALQSVGDLQRFPLIEGQYLTEGKHYTGKVALSLDTEALPLPLRPQTLLSEEWQIKSKAMKWDIQ